MPPLATSASRLPANREARHGDANPLRSSPLLPLPNLAAPPGERADGADPCCLTALRGSKGVSPDSTEKGSRRTHPAFLRSHRNIGRPARWHRGRARIAPTAQGEKVCSAARRWTSGGRGPAPAQLRGFAGAGAFTLLSAPRLGHLGAQSNASAETQLAPNFPEPSSASPRATGICRPGREEPG